jgi:ketosteroid isomerase-like protein
VSQQNVEIVRRLLEANRSDDLETAYETFSALMAEDGTYSSAVEAVEGPQAYRGPEGLRRYVDDLAARWKEWRAEVDEISEVAPNTVVSSFRFHAVSKDMEVPVEARLTGVAKLRDGKVLEGRTFPSRKEAFEAVGLREEDLKPAR